MKSSVFSFLTMLILSSALMVVTPAIASDYTLDIFGNANMDDTIDEDDVTYLEGIIDGTNEETQLADANYDGQIDEADIAQIELIIAGEEKELTLVQYLKHPVAYTEDPVTVSMPITTIAALGGTYGPYMLCALGEADNIVAITDGAKTRGEFRALIEDTPGIGKSTEWDMEKLIELEPDVVLAYACYDYSEYRDILDSVGIPIVQMDFYVPEKYASEVRNLGWMLNKQERVEELINFEQQHLDFIEERVKDLEEEEKPLIYAENYRDYRLGEPTSSITGSIVPCGGVDIFDDLEDDLEVGPEEVIVRDPQVILHMTYSSYLPCGYDVTDMSSMEDKIDDIMRRPGFDQIDAIESGRVYVITSDASSIHPSIFRSYVAKWLHPELFEDMDPVAVHEEWLQKFLGVDFKGVYAYPLIETEDL